MCPLVKRIILLIELEVAAIIGYVVLAAYSFLFDRLDVDALLNTMYVLGGATVIVNIILFCVLCTKWCTKKKGGRK